MNIWENLACGYAFGFLFTAVLGGLVWRYPISVDQRRNAARCMFCSPVWPVVVFYFISIGVRIVWTDADIHFRRKQ